MFHCCGNRKAKSLLFLGLLWVFPIFVAHRVPVQGQFSVHDYGLSPHERDQSYIEWIVVQRTKSSITLQTSIIPGVDILDHIKNFKGAKTVSVEKGSVFVTVYTHEGKL